MLEVALVRRNPVRLQLRRLADFRRAMFLKIKSYEVEICASLNFSYRSQLKWSEKSLELSPYRQHHDQEEWKSKTEL